MYSYLFMVLNWKLSQIVNARREIKSIEVFFRSDAPPLF